MLLILAALGGIYLYKNIGSEKSPENKDYGYKVEQQPNMNTEEKQNSKSETEKNKSNESTIKSLPMLIDIGAGTCVPCKMMLPILDKLKIEYEGKVAVKLIDVYKNREEAMKYGIKVIPTQVFLDSSGSEVFRHEGYMPKEEIVAKFKEMGIK